MIPIRGMPNKNFHKCSSCLFAKKFNRKTIMQVDFVVANEVEPHDVVLERKVGTLIKSYRQKTVQICSYCIKYVSDGSDKADALMGATVFAAANGTEIKLKVKNKKEAVLFRTKTVAEADSFVNLVRKAVRRANVQALQTGCREPEVVEWYYQYQSDLTKEASFMTSKHIIHMRHTLPGQEEGRTSYFHVSMPNDRSGLLFTLDKTTSDGNPLSRFASLYNGRIVSFGDIAGVHLPSGKFETDSTGGLSFTLQTKEDELNLFIPDKGVEWLRAVQALCIFTKIPAPSSRPTGASGDDAATANLQTLNAFSANSGVVFAASGDVLLVVQNLVDRPHQSQSVLDLCEEITAVLRALPDVRCNRDAMQILGDRVEETVRVLGHSDTGILLQIKEEEREQYAAYVSALRNAYADIRNYVKTQRYAGWLGHHISTSTPAKTTLDSLDAALMTQLNRLIIARAMDKSLMFEKKEYVSAADVRKSVEQLGGLDAIYQDTIKERALAKLIQADAAEVSRELAKLHGVAFTGSQRSVHTSFTGVDSTAEKNAAPRTCWYYIFCCCVFGCCCADSTTGAGKTKRKATPSLHEPLVT